ncbi:MAG: hypothetical protein L0Y39_03185 [Methylococcaceae bacterium]|nr:hypothetical protein [Methylococcaceae bacterium]
MPVEEKEIVDAIVTLAAEEAVEAGYVQISTAHLLIALSRISEAQELRDSAAIRELNREFEQLGIEPRIFRRRLRAILGRRNEKPGGNTIHRSAGCKAVFAAAQRAASDAGAFWTPVWLLRGVFASLGDDGSRVAAESGADDIPYEL